MGKSNRDSVLFRDPPFGERRKTGRGELAPKPLCRNYVGSDVVAQRYKSTGIMLCPDELAAYAASRVVTRVFRLCRREAFLFLNNIGKGGLL